MKINLTTLGCAKNLVDSEVLLGGLKGEGVEFVDDPLHAETIILNTCGFIDGAKEESVDAILQAVELKRRGTCRRVFVTGCLSQRYRDELMQEIPEVDGFYGNRDMTEVLRGLVRQLDLRRELLGERELMTPRHYAYLKISEGCENPCTFCAIPAIRGPFSSKPLEMLVDEAQMLADRGVRELLLIAQDSTIYGRDRYGQGQLPALLRRLIDLKSFRWIRLLYTYPAHFGDDVIEIIADAPDVLSYVDVPIQHISDRILKKMARKVTRKEIERLIEKLRQANPDIALRSTFIVGFPGETEQDHRELADFLLEVQFERLGLFAYSREEGTPAYHFPDQVPDHLKQERLAELNDLQAEISLQKNKQLLGTAREVVVDEFDGERRIFKGRTSWDCPEIDNAVLLQADDDLAAGAFVTVEVTGCSEYELKGIIRNDPMPRAGRVSSHYCEV
ncbi:MAG: 30S ribosomal protein S12 methylthiotransferase RimO [Calditrichaeota bacterium]|nr:MAG: 30S ribosomal protein S12 methylthiotransferase RimO [Calditrichota bacterium]